MTTYELNSNEMQELKYDFIARAYDMNGLSPSYGAFAAAEDLPDIFIHEFYDGIAFVEDDFFCNCT